MSKNRPQTAIFTAYDDESFFDPYRPEKSLLLAVLLNALTDLNKRGREGRKAAEYLLSQDDDYVFSFRSICDYLEIDSDRILKTSGVESE